MLKLILFVVAVTATACGGAFGQSSSTNADAVQFLHQACQQAMGTSPANFCLGYIKGIGDLMFANGIVRDHIPTTNTMARTYLGNTGGCTGDAAHGEPAGAAMIQAFANWAAAHPERWGDRAWTGVVKALAKAWPCPN